jgi:hypothetical protein
MVEHWRNWISAFDKAVDSDDWDSLRPLLADDASYTVSGAPFACHLAGADAVLAGFRRSIANFDRQFDQRWWFGVGVREFSRWPGGRDAGLLRCVRSRCAGSARLVGAIRTPCRRKLLLAQQSPFVREGQKPGAVQLRAFHARPSGEKGCRG